MRCVYGSPWAADGVFTLFALLFFFVGAQFTGLGLLGEYIGRIYHDVRDRPRSFIQEIKNNKSDLSGNKITKIGIPEISHKNIRREK
jgi:undecaprenyl-phosphate 4-deoxy-4-formamido-L-arabinose transferase